MDSKQLALRSISTRRGAGGGKTGTAASSLATASFRVYYSLRAGAVPFLWESAPGTPKSGATAVASPESPVSSAADAAMVPPISPPPFQPKGRRCRARSSSWPAAAGAIVRALLGVFPLVLTG